MSSMSLPSELVMRTSVEVVHRPVISFVIPVFNDEENIARCLRSIQELQIPEQDYEIIVLDNGSTDRTQEILQTMGIPFRVITDGHVSVLRNQGAHVATGDYLAFVDSDVELFPEWAKRGLSVFQDSKIVAAGCFPGVPDTATWVQQAWDVHQRGRLTMTVMPIAWLPSMNLMVRRETFMAVEGFNEQLETAEDVDLCYRLAGQGIILCNPTMRAIHWGEAKDLTTFWKKEVWRGIGNIKGAFSHGFRLDEVPSIGYPLYVLFAFTFLGVGSYVDMSKGEIWFIPVNLAILVLPALALAVKAGWQAKQPASVFPLCVLYLLYGCARAYSVLKALFKKSKKG